MQVPILSGITTDEAGDYRTSHPINMIPVPKAQGISPGYLRPAEGLVATGTGPGVCRGVRCWGDDLYAVMGTKLVTVAADGTVTEIGDVGGTGRVSMDHSFDYLAIASGGNLWLWDGETLGQNVDPDLGTVLDVVWVNGYFLTTDGEFIAALELTNPYAVDPLKYGSSEADPDPIVGLHRLRNELVVLNRHTIETFGAVASTGFPFQRIVGAQIQKGCVGAQASARYLEGIAFVGGSDDDATAIWLGVSGRTSKISTREIDQILEDVAEPDIARIRLMVRSFRGHSNLYVYLPDQTLVYDAEASRVLERPVWYVLSSGADGLTAWRCSDAIWCHGQWNVFDTQTPAVGVASDEVSTHWGDVVSWEFSTIVIWNQTRGAIIHEIELTALTGRVTGSPTIGTQYSLDGQQWSSPRFIPAGKRGERNRRLRWLNQGSMRSTRMQRFMGDSNTHISPTALMLTAEGLTV